MPSVGKEVIDLVLLFDKGNGGRDKSVTPSGFTLKLRKHIRTRRLEDVRQLGIDRVTMILNYEEASQYWNFVLNLNRYEHAATMQIATWLLKITSLIDI